ncbi:MAG: hypothetical protein IKT78_05045, partial [Ruminiclostridium sp.]|nr:hypothetical protein [Ruminiclostridium sp.]
IPSLMSVPSEIKEKAMEIRFKTGQPIRIRYANTYYTLQDNFSPSMAKECIDAFCRYSVHNYEDDIKNGFITLKGGHRAGFSGTAVYTGGKISYIKNISSVNIRIAREHIGLSDSLTRIFYEEAVKGLLIIGKPLSGKTTILRDLCRNIGESYRLSIIDERNEIAACYEGVNQLSIGSFSDVFTGFMKKDGIERAIRTMSPDYIVLDELGADLNSIENMLNSGVGMIMTAHAYSDDEINSNYKIKQLLNIDALSHIAVLSKKEKGKVEKIIRVRI